MDSKHQSIAQTTSDRIMEATNTTTALWDNSFRVGQLVLCTSSLYDSLIFSTSFILSRFFIVAMIDIILYYFSRRGRLRTRYSFSQRQSGSDAWSKSDWKLWNVTSTEGRNRTHINGFGDRSPTIGGLPYKFLGLYAPKIYGELLISQSVW